MIAATVSVLSGSGFSVLMIWFIGVIQGVNIFNLSNSRICQPSHQQKLVDGYETARKSYDKLMDIVKPLSSMTKDELYRVKCTECGHIFSSHDTEQNYYGCSGVGCYCKRHSHFSEIKYYLKTAPIVKEEAPLHEEDLLRKDNLRL